MTELIRVTICVPITNPLYAFFSASVLYDLLSYQTTQIGRNRFLSFYDTFTKNPNNKEFLVQEPLDCGKGNHSRVFLTRKGLNKFAVEHERYFQFCSVSTDNLFNACEAEFERIANSEKFNKRQLVSTLYVFSYFLIFVLFILSFAQLTVGLQIFGLSISVRITGKIQHVDYVEKKCFKNIN